MRSRLLSRRRSCRLGLLGAVLSTLLALAAFTSAPGLAQAPSEPGPQGAGAAEAQKAAEHAQQEAAARAAKEAEKAAQQAKEKQAREQRARERKAREKKAHSHTRNPPRNPKEREDASVAITCTSVTISYHNFPEAKDNTVEEWVVEKPKESPPVTITKVFKFNGANGQSTIAIDAPPGHYQIDTHAKWNTNGFTGDFDIPATVTCAPAPAFTLEKLQLIAGAGGGESFTTKTLRGAVAETDDYEVIVTNTGNVKLTLTFTDANCEAAAGGPKGPLAPMTSATFTCSHLLDTADQTAGTYSNTATVTGTPPSEQGSPVTHNSNTVVVDIPNPAFTIEKLQQIAGSGGAYTTSPVTGTVGQVDDYEIVVTDTGNTELALSNFTDPNCDPGTLSGGPGKTHSRLQRPKHGIGTHERRRAGHAAGTHEHDKEAKETNGEAHGGLQPGGSATYVCTHVLTATNATAGTYSNTATVTATPPSGEGAAIVEHSNTVVATVKPASATSPGSASSSTAPTSTALAPKSGVLASGAASAPALKGPQGCVRSAFRASIAASGVQSVTFYLDGHKLGTLTAKNASKGLLTVAVNPASLGQGAHALVAKITMAPTPSSTKAVQASRTLAVVRCAAPVVAPKFTG